MNPADLNARYGGTVLLVDDDPRVRTRLGALLDQAGYVVHEAGDGITALQRVAQADVVLLDLQLPRRSGMEVLQQLATEACR